MDRKFTFIIIGIIFWASAALLMHFVGPYVFDGGVIHIVFWIANFFLPVIALPLIAKLTKRNKNEMLIPTVFIAIPAMILDAVSITLDTLGLTHIYADTAVLAGNTGGFLLFAFASFFIWAVIWHKD
jgi:hypothetical protein